MDLIEKTNWLSHRWPVALETYQYGQWLVHVGKIDGLRVHQSASRAKYDEWFAKLRPQCLARFVASRPQLHPAVVLITAGEYRLGRIPAELWCGYDVLTILDFTQATLLSAKARAMFPEWPGTLVRVVREDQVGGLNLRPAPAPPGSRLRLVA